MIEFNEDGSLKLPGYIQKQNNENKNKMQNQHCIKVRKEIISFKSPKECLLTITVSNALTDIRFLINIFNEINNKAETPLKFEQTDIKEFQIKVGTSFRRCSECTSIINRYREHLSGNIILDKGNCTYEDRRQNFSELDYFE